MDGEGAGLGIAGDEGVGAQGFDGGVELEGIGGNRGERFAEMFCALGEDFFWDGLGG